jgi:hypothetical protein
VENLRFSFGDENSKTNVTKNCLMCLLGMESVAFRLVAQYINQLRYRVTQFLDKDKSFDDGLWMDGGCTIAPMADLNCVVGIN